MILLLAFENLVNIGHIPHQTDSRQSCNERCQIIVTPLWSSRLYGALCWYLHWNGL